MSLTESIQAEQSVLGAVLLDDSKFASVAPIVNTEDFSDPINKKVWAAILECDEKSISIDMLTVADKMGMEYMSYLGDLSAMTMTSSNAEAYAQIVSEKAKYRRLASIGSGINLLMEDNAKAEEVEEYIGQQLQGAADGQEKKTQSIMGSAVKKLIERTDDRMTGKIQLYSTGLKDLDGILQLEPGRMMVIAGRPWYW